MSVICSIWLKLIFIVISDLVTLRILKLTFGIHQSVALMLCFILGEEKIEDTLVRSTDCGVLTCWRWLGDWQSITLYNECTCTKQRRRRRRRGRRRERCSQKTKQNKKTYKWMWSQGLTCNVRLHHRRSSCRGQQNTRKCYISNSTVALQDQ